MRTKRILAIALPIALLSLAEAAAPASVSLEGLWRAQRRFGPEARGELVLRREGTAFVAEMMGRRLPVASDHGRLAFELPGGQGRFRGERRAEGIRGYWYPPASMAMGGHVTPVTLEPEGENQWRGDVVPFDDVFTFFLLLHRRPDGSFDALLRNTERDFGALLGAERLTVEGTTVKLLGRRRGQPAESEIAPGSYDAENDRLILDFPGRGGTYDFQRDGDESNFYPRGKSPGRYVYARPIALDDGWPTGTPEEAGLDRGAVERLVQTVLDMPMDSVDSPQVHAVLLARHGKLVLEEYFHGERRDKLHETRSAAKSMTATIVGAAIQAGAPLSLSSAVYAVMNGAGVPEDLEPRKRAMTLEHLLTMSSGFYCDDGDPKAPGNENGMWEQSDEPDFYRYSLRVPMATTPGERAVYCSASPNLALGMLARATGESPFDTFQRLVGDPLQIRRFGWGTDPAGNPYGGGGVQFLPRDFMKIGQLMLDGGTWKGKRILGRDFVDRASSSLVHIGDRGYGYLWWITDYPYGNKTVHTFSAAGSGGQLVTVVPELDLVIASFGGSYSSGGWRWFQFEAIPKLVLPAVR